MAVIPLQEPRTRKKVNKFQLFALGFRPFFLFAGLSAVGLIAIWTAAFLGVMPLNNYYGFMLWHQHEMLFGYGAAVVAGFLLTAVGNWTGAVTLVKKPLAFLAIIWLLARVLPFMADWVPHIVIAAVDIAFLPGVIAGLYAPLMLSKNRANQAFMLILAAMTVANLMIHFAVLGWIEVSTNTWVTLSWQLIVLVMAIFAGRVVGFFTEKMVPGARNRNVEWVEKAAVPVVLVWMACWLLGYGMALPGIIAALAAALVHGIRLSLWFHKDLWRAPMMWVLHAAYWWVVLGFVLQALVGLGVLVGTSWVHAFTLGGLGGLTVGMMSRVSLGHTGRTVSALTPMAPAFVLLNIAAVVRVVLPMIEPAWLSYAVAISGVVWVVAFAGFCVLYAPILILRREDGQPG